jgi:hypothetical protein
MSRALLPILWAVLVLPSANFGRFDGLPLDTLPELVGLLLLLPLTVSGALRRYLRRRIGAWGRVAPAVLVALGLAAVGGKLALFASGTYQGFVGCYRSTLVPPPTGPCERSYANPWFRYSVTRIDSAIDLEPERWNLGFLNAMRFDFTSRPVHDRPLRDRIPLEVVWQGVIERPTPWMARLTYVGAGTLRLGVRAPGDEGPDLRLPRHYAEATTVQLGIPAGRHRVELAYRFDDGTRWPAPSPVGPGATVRFEQDGPGGSPGTGMLVEAAPPAAVWRVLAAAVDSIVLVLGATVTLSYLVLLRRDWWLALLIVIAGLAVSRFPTEAVGLPTAFGVFMALLCLALALFGRTWRRRLVLSFFSAAYLNVCLLLSSIPRLDLVLYRPPSDALVYESQARSILETWSLQGGEPVFRFQPGFRYWRFVERLVLGDGDPIVSIVALTALAWGCLWAIARLWRRPAPSWPCGLAYALGAGLLLGLATSTPVATFVEAPLSEYPTWILLPLTFTLLFTTRRARRWLAGGILGGIVVLCRLNHLPAILGYLAVFGWQRWRTAPRAAALTVGLALAMLTLPPIHNRYYGGPATEAHRIMNVNRAALAIDPSRLARLHRDPDVRRDLGDQVRGILYVHGGRGTTTEPDRFARLMIRGLQWLWLGTAIVVLPRRGLAPGAKSLLLVPLLYFVVHLLYTVDTYYPRHILAGHFALGVSVLYAHGPGWPRPMTARPIAPPTPV